MRQLDYKKGYYRRKQTITHRRMLKERSEKVSIKTLYYTVLFFLILAIFNNTLNPQDANAPTSTDSTKNVKELPILDSLAFKLPQMPFKDAFKAFASEAKPQVIPTPTGDDSWENFKQTAHAIAKIYSYPVNLIESQAALESAHGTSGFAVYRNNYFGIGAYDTSPNSAFDYENPAQSIIDYIYVVKNNFPEAWANRNDAATVLNLLESNSYGTQYASDPQYIQKVQSMPEWNDN